MLTSSVRLTQPLMGERKLLRGCVWEPRAIDVPATSWLQLQPEALAGAVPNAVA